MHYKKKYAKEIKDWEGEKQISLLDGWLVWSLLCSESRAEVDVCKERMGLDVVWTILSYSPIIAENKNEMIKKQKRRYGSVWNSARVLFWKLGMVNVDIDANFLVSKVFMA